MQNDGRRNGASCAGAMYVGAWWYSYGCGYRNLNGEYVQGGHGLPPSHGLVWYSWKGSSYSLQKSMMMVRRK